MRIAIPVVNGQLAMHFGHCQTFLLIDVDPDTKAIQGSTETEPPPHAPGVIPRWLAEQKANVIIAGGMGRRAQDLFTEQGIEVIIGAPAGDPTKIVKQYLEGSLETGDNVCDH